MLKEFGQWLAGQNKPTHVVVGDKTYAVTGDGMLQSMDVVAKQDAVSLRNLARAEFAVTDPGYIQITTLQGIIDYIRENPDGLLFDMGRNAVISIESPTMVSLYTAQTEIYNRMRLIRSEAIVPQIQFGQRWSIEDTIIRLNSQFVQTPHRDDILKIVSGITEESKREIKDNGLSQTVTAKAGVATVANVTVPNPALLAPFRTYVEIEQPASYYVARLHDGPSVSITDASGGEWRIIAIQRIKDWFAEQLEGFDGGIVHILA